MSELEKCKLLIIILIILCTILLYTNYRISSSKQGLPPSRRKKNMPYDILYLNEQLYYKSLKPKEKKRYSELNSDDKLDAIKTDMASKLR